MISEDAEERHRRARGNRWVVEEYAAPYLRGAYEIPESVVALDGVLDVVFRKAFPGSFQHFTTGTRVEVFNVSPGQLEVAPFSRASPWEDSDSESSASASCRRPDVRFVVHGDPGKRYLHETSLREYLATTYSKCSAWPSTTASRRLATFRLSVNGYDVKRHVWDDLLYTGEALGPTKLEYAPKPPSSRAGQQANKVAADTDLEAFSEALRSKEIRKLDLLAGHVAPLADEPGASRNTHQKPDARPFGILICVNGRVVDLFEADRFFGKNPWQMNAPGARAATGLGSTILLEIPKGIPGLETNTNKDGFQQSSLVAALKDRLRKKLSDFCKQQHQAQVPPSSSRSTTTTTKKKTTTKKRQASRSGPGGGRRRPQPRDDDEEGKIKRRHGLDDLDLDDDDDDDEEECIVAPQPRRRPPSRYVPEAALARRTPTKRKKSKAPTTPPTAPRGKRPQESPAKRRKTTPPRRRAKPADDEQDDEQDDEEEEDVDCETESSTDSSSSKDDDAHEQNDDDDPFSWVERLNVPDLREYCRQNGVGVYDEIARRQKSRSKPKKSHRTRRQLREDLKAALRRNTEVPKPPSDDDRSGGDADGEEGEDGAEDGAPEPTVAESGVCVKLDPESELGMFRGAVAEMFAKRCRLDELQQLLEEVEDGDDDLETMRAAMIQMRYTRGFSQKRLLAILHDEAAKTDVTLDEPPEATED